MKIRTALACLALALALPACVPSSGTVKPLTVASVEDQKKEIARQRDAGEIGYAEAARRQYAIQTANYSLTPGEHAFWQASISEANRVDGGEISPVEYQQRVKAAYARYVGARS